MALSTSNISVYSRNASDSEVINSFLVCGNSRRIIDTGVRVCVLSCICRTFVVGVLAYLMILS